MHDYGRDPLISRADADEMMEHARSVACARCPHADRERASGDPCRECPATLFSRAACELADGYVDVARERCRRVETVASIDDVRERCDGESVPRGLVSRMTESQREDVVDRVVELKREAEGEHAESGGCPLEVRALIDEVPELLRREPSPTGYRCPECGNVDSFTVDHVDVGFSNVPVTMDGWDWADCESDGTDPGVGAMMTCSGCGHEDSIESFED